MRFKRWHHPTWGWTTKPETSETKAIETELAEGAFTLSHFDVAVPVVGHVWVDDNVVVAFKPAGKERIEGRILTRFEYEEIGYNPFAIAENELGMDPVEGRRDEGHAAGLGIASDSSYLGAARWHFERLPFGQRSKPYLSVLPLALRAEDYPHARFEQERRRTGKPPPLRGAAGGQRRTDDQDANARQQVKTAPWKDEAAQRAKSERTETGEKVNAGTDMEDARQRDEEYAPIGVLGSNRFVRSGAIIAVIMAVAITTSVAATWLTLGGHVDRAENAAESAARAAEMTQEFASKAEESLKRLTEEAAKAVDMQLKEQLIAMLGTDIDAGTTVEDLTERIAKKWAEEVEEVFVRLTPKNNKLFHEIEEDTIKKQESREGKRQCQKPPMSPHCGL